MNFSPMQYLLAVLTGLSMFSSLTTAASTGGCPTGYFPCYEDCCQKGVQFCNGAAREKRCDWCELRKQECGTQDEHEHCLLYCHNLLQATTTTATATTTTATTTITSSATTTTTTSSTELSPEIIIIIAVLISVGACIIVLLFYKHGFPTKCRRVFGASRRGCVRRIRSKPSQPPAARQPDPTEARDQNANGQNATGLDTDRSLRRDNSEARPLVTPGPARDSSEARPLVTPGPRGGRQQAGGDAVADHRALNGSNHPDDEEDPLLRTAGNDEVGEGETFERCGAMGGEAAVEQLRLTQRALSDDSLSTTSASSADEVASARGPALTAGVRAGSPAASAGRSSTPPSPTDPGPHGSNTSQPQPRHQPPSQPFSGARATSGRASSANRHLPGRDTPPQPAGVAVQQEAPDGAHQRHHANLCASGYPVNSLSAPSLDHTGSRPARPVSAGQRPADHRVSDTRAGGGVDPPRDHHTGHPTGSDRDSCNDKRFYTNPTNDANDEHRQRVEVAIDVRSPVENYNTAVNPQSP